MVLNSTNDVSQGLLLGNKVLESHRDDAPPSKRLRTLESTDNEDPRNNSNDEAVIRTPKTDREDIPDSDTESNVGGDGQQPTDLESALPPVKADKEAIQEYEAMRMVDQDLPEDLRARLGQRNWIKGKTSIYVDAFNLALETVLDDEKHLFDQKEIEIFDQWRQLEYEAQYLYVRLFLRKTSAWHRINRLSCYSDIADISATTSILQRARELPGSTAAVRSNPGEPAPPVETVLGSGFSFADSEEMITTLEEASSLLSLDELKAIAKEAKVQGKNKAGLLSALRRTSQRQSGLAWVGVKRSRGEEEATESPNQLGLASGDDRTGMNRDGHFRHRIMAGIGPCIRLSLPTLKLFERVHLVFYRSTEWTEKSLTTIILSQISRRNFPEYIVSRSTNIFPSRHDLLEFEAALRTQFRVDSLLESSGNSGMEGLKQVLDVFEEIYPRWKDIVKEEQQKEDRVYESGEGAYLRRFSPAWVYTRIMHKGMYVLGRFKMYGREHEVATELIDQQLFHAARRGAWYQRKALLEEHYMPSVQPSGVASLEQQKRHWKRIALQTCEQGLQDNDCHVIYHYGLQKRISKLEKQLRIPKREQHDFGHVLLAEPTKIAVYGIQIKREYPPARRPGATVVEERRSSKTVWLDELGSGGECSVEEMCLSWYRSQGMKGYHSEGGIIRTLFSYLFYDILFTYIPNVFQTAYQICPLDLHTDAFYPSRLSEINHRLVEIANGEAGRLIRAVNDRERGKKTCVVGLSWDFEVGDLLEIAGCLDGSALATICKVLAQGYRVRGGGMPDLLLWDPVRKTVVFAEVKSENDRLSDTQRLWIDVLTGAGMRVDLCNAVAREVRAE